MQVTDHDRLAALEHWFHEHLPYPERLSISRRPHAAMQCLSWFRASATDHIEHAREMIGLLREYDVAVETLRAERPGYVVYEDDYQVVALPFADTPT